MDKVLDEIVELGHGYLQQVFSYWLASKGRGSYHWVAIELKARLLMDAIVLES